MTTKRPRPYVPAGGVFVGAVLLALAPAFPVLTASSSGGQGPPLTFRLAGDVQSHVYGRMVWAAAVWIVVAAAVLVGTRRRGWQLAARTTLLMLTAVPAYVAVRLWHAVAAPSTVAGDSALWDLTVRTGTVPGPPFLGQHADVSAAAGLWLLSSGSLLVITGCLLPAASPFPVRRWTRDRSGVADRAAAGPPPGPETAPPPAFT
jgi:hypothetical protein